MASVLQGANEPSTSGETTPMFSTPDTIWLTGCMVDEAALCSLVSLHPLKQLKLNCCILASFGSILHAIKLCDYLADAVLDLDTIHCGSDGKIYHFP